VGPRFTSHDVTVIQGFEGGQVIVIEAPLDVIVNIIKAETPCRGSPPRLP
jgi:hypothetical protein